MAAPWLAAFPHTCHPFLQQTDHILQLRTPLSSLIATGPSSTLSLTEIAQPAIMATSCMILRVLEQDFGFRTAERVDITLGHSLGEFAALVAGGYWDYETGLKICRRRAEAMAKASKDASLATGGGAEFGMVALVCQPERLDGLIATIEEFLGYAAFPPRGGEHEEEMGTHRTSVPAHEQVLIANINSKNQIVLSGDVARIQALLVQLRQFGGHDPRAVRLKADSPFHSPIMAPAAHLMTSLLNSPATKITFPGAFPSVSNVSARPFSSIEDLRDLLARQCVETVRWWDSIRWLDQEFGVKRWVGLGPGKVGRNLVGKEVGMQGAGRGAGVWGVSGPGDVEECLRGLEETEAGEGEEVEKERGEG